MSVGVDILKISRLENLASNQKFLSKVFSKKEIEYFKTRNFNKNTVAGAFCAKEALAKAIGCGLSGLPLTEISVVRNNMGKPYFEFSPEAENALKMYKAQKIALTISHDNDMAIAYVCVDADEDYQRFKTAAEKSNTNEEGIISFETARSILPKRDENSHKGSFGRVFAIAGSTGLTGAARLACEAMLKTGSGLITLGTPKSLNNIFEITLKEVMTYPLCDKDGILTKDALPKIFDFLKNCDVCLIGCGMSLTLDTRYIVEKIIETFEKPLIIDADGINAVAMNINVLTNHRQSIVLTPHLGEFARLVNRDIDFVQKNGESLAVDFAKKYNVVIVLKSHRTKVVLPSGKVYTNVLGNSGMATGGSGDVLAGIITSLAGQKISINSAAVLGVYLHSLAADMAALKLGEYSLTPSDIINTLAYALKFLGG